MAAPTVLEIARTYAGEHVTSATLIADIDPVDYEFVEEGIEDECYVHIGERVERCATLGDLQVLVDDLVAVQERDVLLTPAEIEGIREEQHLADQQSRADMAVPHGW